MTFLKSLKTTNRRAREPILAEHSAELKVEVCLQTNWSETAAFQIAHEISDPEISVVILVLKTQALVNATFSLVSHFLTYGRHAFFYVLIYEMFFPTTVRSFDHVLFLFWIGLLCHSPSRESYSYFYILILILILYYIILFILYYIILLLYYM